MARDAVSEVRDRIGIVDLVQPYVPSLKRAGRSYKGLCPFHQEKTPSFVVFPDSENFHCFGCGKGGDIFTFYMLAEHVEFREALRELAQRAGIELESMPATAPKHDEHRLKLIELNGQAQTFFAHVLTKSRAGEVARQELTRRGVSDEMIQRFGLGYAPSGWDNLARYFSDKQIDLAQAHEAGLLQERDNGGYYDRFRERLMFPIHDRDGNTVGFGGRVIGDGVPKYLNTPQTPVFDKSSLVFAYDLARDAIRNADEVVIVEGYMDVIAAHQLGYENVVAAMGTAITEPQVSLLKRASKRLVLALDADAAGQMATLRSLDTLRETLDADEVPVPDAFGMVRFERKLSAEIAIVTLPEGKDPDELIRKSPERWPEIVKSARPVLDFTIDVLTRDIDRSDARAKSAAVQRIAPLFQQIPDRIVQGHYINQLAKRLDLDERLVLSEIRRARLKTTPKGPASQQPVKPARQSTEDHLFALLLRHRDLTHEVAMRVPADDLGDTRNRELLRYIVDPDLAGLTPEQLIAGLDDELADHAEATLAAHEGRPEQFPGQIQREANEVLDRLRAERYRFLLRQLQQHLLAAEQEKDREMVDALRQQLNTLAQRHAQYDPPLSPYFKDLRTPQHG